MNPQQQAQETDKALTPLKTKVEIEAFRLGWQAGFNRGFVAGAQAEKIQPSEVLFNKPS